jgi:hypothetical protein
MNNRDTYSPEQNDKLSLEVKKYYQDNLIADVAPEVIQSRMSRLVAADYVNNQKQSLALDSPREVQQALRGIEKEIKGKLREMFAENPALSSLINEEASAQSAIQIAKSKLITGKFNLEAERRKHPADYQVKYNASAKAKFSTARTPEDFTEAISFSNRSQVASGTHPDKVIHLPSAISTPIAESLDRGMETLDGKATVTNEIIMLKAKFGTKLPAIMNQLVDSGKLKHKEIAEVLWMSDTNAMRSALSDLSAMDSRKTAYDADNKDSKGRAIVDVDNLLTVEKMKEFLPFSAARTDGISKRMESMRNIVKAKYYSLMEGKAPNDGHKKAMRDAYDLSIGKMYTKTTFGKSTTQIPNTFDLSEDQVRAAMKTGVKLTQERMRMGQVDFSRMPGISQQAKYVGLSEADKQEAFWVDNRDKIMMIHPPSDGRDSVLRAYIPTQRGNVAVAFKGEQPFVEFPLDQIKEDIFIEGQRIEDVNRVINGEGEDVVIDKMFFQVFGNEASDGK